MRKQIIRLCLIGICGVLTVEAAMAQKNSRKASGFEFTIDKEVSYTSVKDQANTGTCWSFATSSFIESELWRQTGQAIDLSEMFFVNYTYRQKAENYIRYQGKANFSEGGQAHDVMLVITQFGMMPEDGYNGINYNKSSHDHAEMVEVLSAILDTGLKFEADYSGKPTQVVNAALEVYLGAIPDSFEYQQTWYTPLSFAAHTGFNPDDYVELTSFSHHPFYSRFNLEIADNWRHALYYNIPLDELLSVINYAFAQNYSVNWDGDISNEGFSHRHGLALLPDPTGAGLTGKDKALWDEMTPEERLNIAYSFDKPRPELEVTQQSRQLAFDHLQTTDDHLMHMVGTATDQFGNKYYMIKNSWAPDSNKLGGMLFMSEAYLKMGTIAIQVHKNAIPAELRSKLGI